MSKRGTLLFILTILIAASFSANQQLTTQSCSAENSAAAGSFASACLGTYPAACGAAGDLISCNDGLTENHSIANGGSGFGGIKSTEFNSSITSCLSVTSVFLCYEWWTTATSTSACDISVSNDSSTFVNTGVACPGTLANPGQTCINVTSNATWRCSNFFGPSGTRAQAKSELHSSSGAATTLWDVLFFNVTYTPLTSCSVISTSGQYSQGANLIGAPNAATSVVGNSCIRINTSNVIYDCNGFNITNNGTAGSTFGIILDGNLKNVTVRNCPGISQYTHGVYVQTSNNSIVSNVTSYNNTVLDFSVVGSNNITITNNTGRNSTSGIDLSGTKNSTVSNNNVFNLSSIGISLSSNSSGNNVTGNNASNISTAGFDVNNATNNNVSNNLATNTTDGFLLDFSSSNNLLDSNNATALSYGFVLVNASSNNLTNNLATVVPTGFYLSVSANNNRLILNTAHDTTNEGFYLITNSNNNVLANNTAFNGVNRGFRVQDNSNNNIIANNTAYGNNDTGLIMFTSSGNNITGNNIHNNNNGIDVETSNDTTFSGNLVSNSSATGINLVDSNRTIFTGDRTYNNSLDFQVVAAFVPSVNVNLSRFIFDSPSGSISSYTNLSLNDTLNNITGYTINWTANSTVLPLPANRISFAQKFINMTNLTGGVSVDKAAWNWLDSELPPSYTESQFELWKYNGTGWHQMNATPDTVNNALSLSNINTFSIFAILQVADFTPPNVTLNSPPNAFLTNNSTVKFNFTAVDDQSASMNCSLFIDGVLNATNSSTTNNTPSVFTVPGIPDGLHSWNVTCKDSGNNTGNSTTRSFTVDTTAPAPNLISPANNSFTNKTSLNLTYNFTDNLSATANCSLFLDGVFNQSNSSVTNNTNTNFSLSGLAQGLHNWSVSCQDLAGNNGSSSVGFFTVDTTAPTPNLISPSNNAFFNTNSINLTYNFTDNLSPTANCSLILDGLFNQSNSSVTNNTNTNFSVSGLSQGLHNWSVSCKDLAGNTGSSSSRNFTVDTTPPTVTQNSPANNAFLNSTTVTFNFTATDNLAPSMLCQLFIDSVLNQSGINATNNTAKTVNVTGFTQGLHNWSVSCNDSANNTGSSASRNFTIDTTAPVVTLNSPADGSTISNSNNVSFNFTATDNLSPTMNCSIFLDGVLNATNSAVVNNTATLFNLSGISLGNHTWNVSCKDLANNTGNSATRSFFMAAVSSCPIITSSGTYTQINNLVGGSNSVSPPAVSGFSTVCVKIGASNVVYNCNGFNITNDGTNNRMGVYSNSSHTNITLENCGAISGYKRGVYILSTNNSLFQNNTVLNSTQDGMQLDQSFNNTLNGNTLANNSQNGLEVDSGSNHTFFNNTATFNGQDGITISSSPNNKVYNNSLQNNTQNGIQITTSDNNTIVNNTDNGNKLDGIHVGSSDNNLFENNTVDNNSQDGIQVVTNANNTFRNNTALNNKQHGLHIVGTNINFFYNNTMGFNSQDGMLSSSSTNSTFFNNTAFGNSQNGFLFAASDFDSMTNNTAYNNSQVGLSIDDSDHTTLISNHYFNNTNDFRMNAISTRTLNVTQDIYDRPVDSFGNFTNLSINDTETGIIYTATWSPRPAALPAGCPAFAALTTGEKFINISNVSGNVSILKAVWSWRSDESAPYNTSMFVLARYNGTWRAVPNQVLDTVNNKITVSNINQFGVFGILLCNDSVSEIKLNQTALQASPGGIVQFNITVNNTGNTTLNPVKVVDTLPVGVTFSSSLPSPNSVVGQVVTWNNVTSLAPGATTVIYINATVNVGTVNATNQIVNLTNFANTTGTDPIGVNISANSSANVTVYYANVSVIKLNQTAMQPSPGGTVQFNITVNNTGNVTLNTTLNDTLDSSLTFLSATGSPSVVGQLVTWNLNLTSGSSTTFYLNATVNPGVVNATNTMLVVPNCANATGVPPNGFNVTAQSCANVAVLYANVSIVKLNQTALQPSPGGIVQFNMTVTNTGNVTLNPTQVIDTLPVGVTFSSSTPAPDSVVGQVVTWNNVTSLDPGISTVLYLNATVDPGTVNATNQIVNLTNCANTTGVPPNGFNVSDNSCANVTVFYANVGVVKVDITPIPPSPGGLVQWQMNVSNTGQVTLDPLMVVDTLPPGFTYSNAAPAPDSTGATVIWNNVGPLAPGASLLIFLNTTVDNTTANGTYTNMVTVTGVPPNGDNVSDSDNASVGVFAPAINIVKTANQTANVTINKNDTFTLNISNTGSTNLTVTVKDFLPPNVTFQGADVPPTSVVGQNITWQNITVLPVGGSFVIHYNVSANKNGTYTNNVTATGTPPNGNNVSDTDSATFSTKPNPPSGGGGGGSQTEYLSWSFICPGNIVQFNSTKGGGLPLSGASVRVIYDTYPVYFTLDTLTSGNDGLSSIVLTQNGTYDVYAFDGGYNSISDSFLYTTCPVSGCKSDNECPSDSQCLAGSCQKVACPCGSVQNHSCVKYQCGDGPSCSACPSGASCVEHKCKFECIKDSDCKDNQICDIPKNASGGKCKDITACGLIANHTVVTQYECGGPNCPACPSGLVCQENLCVPRNITCPPQGILGDSVTCHATEGNKTCSFCDLKVVKPNGNSISGITDGNGDYNLTLDLVGLYNVSLLGNGTALKSINVTALPRAAPAEEVKKPLLTTDLCLPLFIILLILALLYYLWRNGINVYNEPGAIGPNTIAVSQGLLDSGKLKVGDTVSLQLGNNKFTAKIVPMPDSLSNKESKAKGEGNFILAGDAVVKGLKITTGQARDTSGLGFESFAAVRGLKIKKP